MDGPPDGEPVILLHGFPENSRQWTAHVAALAEAGYRAVAVDQRGYSPGARPAEVEAYRMPHLVQDVLNVADALGADRFHLVGHDWGGSVAWCTAFTSPERVATLTSFSTPHPRAFADAVREGAQAVPDYHRTFTPDGAEAMLRDDLTWIRDALGSAIPAEHVQEYVRRLSHPEALKAVLSWFAAKDPADVAIGPIGVPSLYVWSDGDPVVRRRTADLTAKWVTSPYRFVALEGIGHWISEEAPELTSRLVVEHVRGS
ncbi:alpha/beta fold hydrolase [Microtetraspora sp. AC03309]|uniref:alpha/beta fold hydrolase n=1 Tax=Microtetraspora sp. AC03309 TaxID=2779376 RepID=UPI001E34FA53|nr:alpha/beta hydrolase [Microtetraspora sp. AC03309]